MNQTVDSRVLEMQFDNAQFERNVQTSLSTLDRLKAALNFGDSAKSLETLGDKASRMNFNGFAGAIDTVTVKFSTLEMIGMTALANITNSAVNAGERLVSSMSIDNVAAGWEKFGEKTSSVATLTAQGYALEEVNKQLDKLNWFTDETSYNFTDMTSNIAKFTATGQDLETSVTAMQGIANWAALSGQNAMTASRAMYQLSQAMGAGVMRKEDYKSIQNASMDTQEFRQKAIEAAIALGTLQDNGDGTYRTLVEGAKAEDFAIGQFADHLTKDMWFTSDVMMKVFQDYSNAVEPIYEFTQEHDILASQVLEAKHALDDGTASFDKYCNGLVESGDLTKEDVPELKKLVEGLDDFGVKALEAAQQARTWADVVDSVKDAVSTAWMKTFELIFGNQEQATQLFTAMANSLYDVFAEPINGMNKLLGEALGAESAAFSSVKDDTQDLTGRGLLIQGFANIWHNLLDTMDLVSKAFRDVFPEASAENIYHAIESFSKFTEGLKLSGETAANFRRTLRGVFAIFDIVKTVVGSIAGAVLPELAKGFAGLATRLLGTTGSIGKWLGSLDKSVKKSELLKAVSEKMAAGVRKAFEIINKVLDVVGPAIKNFIGFAKEHFVTPGFNGLSNILKTISGHLKTAGGKVKSFKDFIVGVFNTIKSKLEGIGFFDAIKNIFSFLVSVGKTVLSSIGKALGGLINAIAHADFKSITEFFSTLLVTGMGAGAGAGVIGFFKEVTGFIKSLKEGKEQAKENPISSLITSVQDTLSAVQEKLKPDLLRSIAVSIGILAASLFVISLIDADKIKSSLGAMAGLFAELMGSMYAYTKIIGNENFASVSGVMIAMSASILILSMALKKIAGIEPDKLLASVITIGVLLGELVGFSILLDDLYEGTAKGMIGMIAMAAAVRILAGACSVLAQIDEDGLLRGVLAIGALLAELSAFSVMATDAEHIAATGAAMLLMAVAVRVLSGAVSSLGSMSWETIGKGLLTMAAALFVITKACNSFPTQMLDIGPSLIAISAAMLIMSGVLRIMGSMKVEQIGKSIGVLGATMYILAEGAKEMSGALKGAGTMIVIAGALAILTPILLILGSMPLTNIAKALIALFGTFYVISVGANMLEPVIDILYKLAGAMALMGLAVGLAGAGILMAGLGMVSFAAGITALGASISAQGAIIVAGITAFLTGIINLIPTLATALARGVIEFIKVIADAAPELVTSIVELLSALLDGIAELAPKIAETMLKLILSGLDLLAQYAPQIVEKAIAFVGGVLLAIADAIRGVDVSNVVDALKGIAVIAAVAVGLSLIAPLIPGAMVGVLALSALIVELGIVFAALGALKQIPGVEWLIGEGSEFANKIGNAIGGFVGSIIGGLAEGVTSALPAIGTNLSDFMTNAEPFFSGVSSMDTAVLDGVGKLSGAIMQLTQAGLLDGITSWLTGSSSITKFADSLKDLAGGLAEYASIIDASAFDQEKVEASKNLASMLASLAANEIPKTGGIIGFIEGESDLGKFGSQLVPLAEGLSAYAAIIDSTTFSKEKIIASKSLAKMLASLVSNDIPKTGGLISFVKGESDLGKFGSQLVPLAVGLSAYAAIIDSTTFSKEKIIASRSLVKMLASLASTDIPKTGGLMSYLEGTQDLGKFGSQLIPLAEGLSAYVEKIDASKFNEEKIGASRRLISMLAYMASQNIPKSGGLIGWIKGDNSLEGFGKQLPSLAKSLTEYADNLGTSVLATTKFNSAKSLFDILIQMSSSNIPAFGDLTTFTDQAPKLAKGLSDYALGLDDSLMDRAKIIASKNLVEMLSALANTTIPTQGGVISFIEGGRDLSVFGSQLPTLALGLSLYSTIVGATPGFSSEAVNKSIELANLLASLASNDIPAQGGVISFIEGGRDLSVFGTQLPILAAGLSAYTAIISANTSFTSEAVNASLELANMLAALATNDIPTQGGVIGFLMGTQDLASFGNQLPVLATGLTQYADNLGSSLSDTSKIEASKTVMSMLTTLSKDVPTSTGFLGKLFKGDDLYNFAKQLPNLGKALTSYADSLGSSLSSDKVKAADNVSKMLVSLQSTVSGQNNGGLFKSGDLTQFGKNLATFATYLVKYCTSFDSVDPAAIQKKTEDLMKAIDIFATGDAKGISSFADNLKKSSEELSKSSKDISKAVDDLVSALTDKLTNSKDSLGKAAKELMASITDNLSDKENTKEATKAAEELVSSFTDGIKISSDVTEAAKKLVEAVTGSIISQTDLASEAGASLNESISGGISDSIDTVSESMENLLTAVLFAVKMKAFPFRTAGSEICTKFADGVKNKASTVKEAFSKVTSDSLKKVKDYKDDFKQVGKDLVQGFADGIKAKQYAAEAKARAMAEAAKKAAKDALKSKSPSKEFYKIGTYAGQGFVNALSDYENISYKAGYRMADYAREGLGEAISRVTDSINSEDWGEPTIRPVLDMSDIRAGAMSINDMFGRTYSLGVRSNWDAFSYRLSNRESRNETDDVVSAIQKLQSAVDNNSHGNTYIIDGITYDDGTNVSNAIRTLIRAAKVGGRA